MPSQTFLIRAHARTIYTHPVTFVCAECHSTTTREIYPGKMPTYCLSCRPRRKKSTQVESSKGMFHPTHHLIAADGRKTEVCLEKSSNPGWSWVRTALDWFSGSSIIQYHPDKGIISHETPLSGYTLIPFQEEQKPQGKSSSSKSKTKTKSKTEQQKKTTKKSQTKVTQKKVASQADTLKNQAYSGRELMQRFRCGERLLRIKRALPNFQEWSKQRDPDGIAWKYQKGKFVPQLR